MTDFHINSDTVEIVRTNLLTKNYGTTAATNNISIHVKKGEIYGCIGLNGAGKTTLIRMLLGMIKPDKGTVTLFGKLLTPQFNLWNEFIVYIIWCLALTISNLLMGLLIGTILQLPSIDFNLISGHLTKYLATTVMTVLIGTPIAFFALWGRGCPAPLGFVALTLVFAQIIAATGYGYYFPWSVPGLFSGAAGEYKAQLNLVSYSILILTSVAEYLATVVFWKYADQTK